MATCKVSIHFAIEGQSFALICRRPHKHKGACRYEFEGSHQFVQIRWWKK